MAKHPTVSIIIATMNTPKLTEACLQSVIKNTSVDYELIVVNNSRADAIRKCLSQFKNIQVIQNPRNFGYTKAANQGALKSHGEFLCFLNSDALVPPGWIERLLEAAKLPGVGAVGPEEWKRDYLREWPSDDFAAIEASTSLIDQAFQKWNSGKLVEATWLCGFCLMISRAVMTSVGSFDERFFFGWEDIDYSCQLRLKGYRLLALKSFFVYHKKRASTNPKRHKQLISESKKMFLKKWGSIFRKKFLHEDQVFSTVNEQVKERKSKMEKSVNKFTRAGRTLIRKALNVRLTRQKQSRLLMRLADMEVFQPDRLGGKIWQTLDGSIPFSSKLSKETSQRIDSLIENGLAGWADRSKNGQIIVTVMMAAHNAGRWIGEAIESVLAQKYRHFELIIADDNSTDGTISIARRYLRYPQVQIIQNTRQLGIAKTRNRILDLARGKYIAVCDADDIMRPTLLERFTNLLEVNPNVGWIYSDRLKIDENNHVFGIDHAIAIDGKRELKHNIIAHAGALIRKQEILKIGGYDEMQPATEDYDLALKIGECSKIMALSGEIHYLWRRHLENTSQMNPWAKSETEQLLTNARHRRRLKKYV